MIIKQNSDHIQWYYRALKPYEHYIPVAHDFSDLIETLQWVKDHDEVAQRISKNANAFAKENLNHDDQLYYLYLLLTEYSKIQN